MLTNVRESDKLLKSRKTADKKIRRDYRADPFSGQKKDLRKTKKVVDKVDKK